MTLRFLYPIFRLILSTHIFIILLIAFLIINISYLWFGGWLYTLNSNYEHLNFITSILGSAATVFAAVAAALLVQNWKIQHNLSLISKLISETWDLHTKLTAEVYKLIYTPTIDLKKQEYNSIYSELIQLAVPLRTKSQQLQILLESRIDNHSWEYLQNFINFLEFFYPWSAIDFLEYRDYKSEFINEFKLANQSIQNVFKKYIAIQ